jgi:membrane protein required for colicin V production
VGGVFGLTRGVLVVMILVLLAGLTSVPRQSAWRDAALRGALEAAAETVKAWLPADFSKRIKF